MRVIMEVGEREGLAVGVKDDGIWSDFLRKDCVNIDGKL